jgi:hypothetical protein
MTILFFIGLTALYHPITFVALSSVFAANIFPFYRLMLPPVRSETDQKIDREAA